MLVNRWTKMLEGEGLGERPSEDTQTLGDSELILTWRSWFGRNAVSVSLGWGFGGRELGHGADAVGPKRILKSTDEAKSPRRILVRSLLKSRNNFVRSIASFEPNAKGGGTKPPRSSGHGVPVRRARWHTKHVPKRISCAGQPRVPTATTPGAIGATRSGIGRVVRGLAALEGAEKKGW